jgi:hypothetical protein
VWNDERNLENCGCVQIGAKSHGGIGKVASCETILRARFNAKNNSKCCIAQTDQKPSRSTTRPKITEKRMNFMDFYSIIAIFGYNCQ